MKTDKLIIKALESKTSELPFDFNSKLMAKINFENAKIEKRKLIISYGIAGLFSAILIGLAVFLLHNKVNFTVDFSAFKLIRIDTDSTLFRFSSFIAIIALFLLFVDGALRMLRHKNINKHQLH